jgi:hypothetical protein
LIWSDDIEHTARILRREHVGYLAADSVVVHRTKEPYPASTGATTEPAALRDGTAADRPACSRASQGRVGS